MCFSCEGGYFCMKRQPIIRRLLEALNDNDVAVISNNLSKEAFEYDRPGNFYLSGTSTIAASFGLGLAIGTKKRVFVFVSDGEFLKDFGVASQLAVSKCKNIFYVILHSGKYQSSGGQPTIFREIHAPKGLLFNLGFLVHDYTHYFKNRSSEKAVSKIIDRVRGPLAILVAVDLGIKKDLNELSYSNIELKERLINFMTNDAIGTSLFNPPSFVGHEKDLHINKEE